MTQLSADSSVGDDCTLLENVAKRMLLKPFNVIKTRKHRRQLLLEERDQD